jgi:hypothetical protein
MNCILFWIEAHPGLAAWIQALGSILAVLGAYWLGGRQSKAALSNSMRMHDVERDQRRQAIVAIMAATKVYIDGLASIVQNTDSDRRLFGHQYDDQTIVGFIDALSQIPIYEIGSAEAVTGLLCFKNEVIFLRSNITAFLEARVPAGTVLYVHQNRDSSGDLKISKNQKEISIHFESTKLALLGE